MREQVDAEGLACRAVVVIPGQLQGTAAVITPTGLAGEGGVGWQ